MQPKLELLDRELIDRIVGEAFELLMTPECAFNPTRRVSCCSLLEAKIDGEIAHIPGLWRVKHLPPCRTRFTCMIGQATVVHYGDDDVYFDPGVIRRASARSRHARTSAVTRGRSGRLIKVAEMLPQLAAQSTAIVCDDVPKSIQGYVSPVLGAVVFG
ncbi:MAG: hypothetical protein U0559_00425 [Anaerolineae bacterium]